MNATDDFQNNVLPVLLAGASIPSLIWLHRTRSKRRLAYLTEALDPSTGEITGRVWLRLDGRRGGRPATLRFESGTRGRTRRLHLFLDSGSVLPFRAQLEDLPMRVAKKLHLARDVQTGIAELDSRYLFSSPEPERFARWIAGSVQARQALECLLGEKRVDVLGQEEGRLHATVEDTLFELADMRWIDALQRIGADVLGRYSPKRTNVEAVRNVFEQMDVIARSAEAV